MIDREKVIKGVHDTRRYLEDREWVDKSVGVYIDAINDALAMLKEQEAIEPVFEQDFMVCGRCGHDVIVQRLIGDEVFDEKVSYCPACGQAVKWE